MLQIIWPGNASSFFVVRPYQAPSSVTIAYASTYEIVGSDNVKLMSSIILSYVQHLPKLVQDLVTKHIIGKDTLHKDLYITYFSVVSPFNE